MIGLSFVTLITFGVCTFPTLKISICSCRMPMAALTANLNIPLEKLDEETFPQDTCDYVMVSNARTLPWTTSLFTLSSKIALNF